MEATLKELCWSRSQSFDALLSEKDRVAGGLGRLLDAGRCDIDRSPIEGELQLARPADGACDHHTGVDTDADPKLATEPLGDFFL